MAAPNPATALGATRALETISLRVEKGTNKCGKSTKMGSRIDGKSWKSGPGRLPGATRAAPGPPKAPQRSPNRNRTTCWSYFPSIWDSILEQFS